MLKFVDAFRKFKTVSLALILSTTAMTSVAADQPYVKRISSVPGYSGRVNDVIYSSSCKDHGSSSKVVFFGGDVQDYPENMQSHRDNHRHIAWNLEATAQLLAKAFPDSEVVVVKPSKMFLKTLSCYDSFVQSSQTGVPSYSDDWGAIKHLRLLLRNVTSVRMKSDSSQEETIGCPDDRKLTIIGFSKGCVVLNQLVHEMASTREASETSDFVRSVQAMYWLDGGHAGGSNVWITDSKLLKHLAESGIRIYVHVTPYQVDDEQRPWIKKEERVFTETLKRLKANITRKLHFADEVPSLEAHFRLLAEFMKNPT